MDTIKKSITYKSSQINHSRRLSTHTESKKNIRVEEIITINYSNMKKFVTFNIANELYNYELVIF